MKPGLAPMCNAIEAAGNALLEAGKAVDFGEEMTAWRDLFERNADSVVAHGRTWNLADYAPC